MVTDDNDCIGIGGTTPISLPPEPCPDCPDTTCDECTSADWTPQACIKTKNGKLVSCSVTILPDGCEKLVKLMNTDYEVLIAGTYEEVNAYIQETAEAGNYYVAEFITCAGDHTSTPNVCIAITVVDDVKSVGCGQCCQ